MTYKALSAQDHARIAGAVAEAEADTDGEIVTIIAHRSDEYRDVALHYALLGVLLVPAIFALFPKLLEMKLGLFTSGWEAPGLSEMLVVLLVVQALVFLLIRYGLEWGRLRVALTPRATRSRRVRRRAVALFRASAEKRTETRVGILLYLSLDEHMAEIVADEAIHTSVPAERWGDAMAALIDHVRKGDRAGGMIAAIAAMGTVLSETFPKSEGNPNELPNRLIEL
ncbi:TPM domain-containing protein [Stakelama pacifica]|uniref:Putative membrane protein n=1 Tax=Stakelama pacifica TaxID=517720 RepID=A0A4R6FVC7_9SPHN|nr:TPM domain-containing protein [Stakelama pacifica]TDN85687.1 putative membrane protein [Stakelama pacifica]GGO91927.1 membrane protein [Stakelama pacifica]